MNIYFLIFVWIQLTDKNIEVKWYYEVWPVSQGENSKNEIWHNIVLG